jgi:hypothetical protein
MFSADGNNVMGKCGHAGAGWRTFREVKVAKAA